MGGDGAGDQQRARRVGVGGVQDPAARRRRDGLDQRRDVGGGAGVIDAGAAVGEEDGRTAVQRPLDEHPLARHGRRRRRAPWTAAAP